MCGRNYAELLEADALLQLSLSLAFSLYFSLYLFALSGVSFNERVQRDSSATLREAVNHWKPEAINKLVSPSRTCFGLR